MNDLSIESVVALVGCIVLVLTTIGGFVRWIDKRAQPADVSAQMEVWSKQLGVTDLRNRIDNWEDWYLRHTTLWDYPARMRLAELGEDPGPPEPLHGGPSIKP